MVSWLNWEWLGEGSLRQAGEAQAGGKARVIGALILVMALGGMIPVYLISKLLDWGIFRRFMEMQEIAIVISVVFAVVLSIGLYGFGHADGGRWNPGWGTVAYFFSGVIVLVLR